MRTAADRTGGKLENVCGREGRAGTRLEVRRVDVVVRLPYICTLALASHVPACTARRQGGCIRSRCTDTHRVEEVYATEEVEQEEEEDEVERGWMAETVSRANGIVCVAVCDSGVPCTPVCLCKRFTRASEERDMEFETLLCAGRGRVARETGSSILNTSLCASARGSVSASVHAAIAETHSRHVRKDDGGGGGRGAGSTRGRKRER